MRILSLHIEGFGKFHNRDISFEDGLNVIYGRNEAGKSTLHTFIRGILFGIERQRGRASKNDVYSKYEPWKDSGTYEGWLRLESDGTVYRIERRFQKGSKSLVIVNETEGREEEPSQALLNRLRCGLSETAYNNTVSIGQLKCATDKGMVSELRNYIANLNTSGSIALNITRASSYLKTQRKQLESQLGPEAARSYAGLLGEIRRIEQEISAPRYANQLSAIRSRKSQVKAQLEKQQSEKEGLLEKTAKGRQILVGSQFSDQASIQSYMAETQALFDGYQKALTASGAAASHILPPLLSVLALLSGSVCGLCLFAPDTLQSVFPDSALMASKAFLPACAGAGALAAVVLAAAALVQISKNRRIRSKLETSSRLLSEIFARHLGDSTISVQSMERLEGRMAEFLRLSKAVQQSEDTLKGMTSEIQSLQSQEERLTAEIEEQQKLQWELEQKLERLSECRNQAEALQPVLAENERIQEELDALDLAQETLTGLSTSIRDSFGLYLNKTASELIEGLTGGAYKSMSIDQNLDIFMNTPSRLVPIEQVSSGTMDQIYLAVRLAAARLVQSGEDSMPLIFDDSFTLYDDERLKTALKWLAASVDSQIIIFTCHQREAQLLTANQIPYHLISI